jgi:uncharacterized protein with HEPN domain
LTILGEALNRLMKIQPATAADITDARQIIAFRNILVHGYDVVRNEVVWEILETGLPILAREVDALLAQGEEDKTANEES